MPARSRTITSAVAVAATAVVLAGCGNSPDNTQAPAAGGVQLVSEGKLTTCTHLPYEPFQFNDGGKIVGFDVEVIDLVATKLGVTQEIIDTPFEGIQSGEDLNIGKCDVAAAAMTITETRQQNFDFSDPYFDATQALLVKSDAGITATDAATAAQALAGKKVGVQNSTTGQEWAQENLPNSEQVVFEDLGLLTTAAQTGQVDAAINDNGPLLDFAKKNPEMAVTAEFDTGEQYGIGVRKGNTEVLQAVNEALTAARSDGTYDKIYEKWFGKAPGA